MASSVVGMMEAQPYPLIEVLTRAGNSDRTVDRGLAKDAINSVLGLQDREVRERSLAALLVALLSADPDPRAVAGLVDGALAVDKLDIATRPKLECSAPSVAVAGSGKKGFKTVNLSSLSCAAAACLGVSVVKLCSPGTSSVTGSEDFLRSIGAPDPGNLGRVIELVQEIGLGFVAVEQVLPEFAAHYAGRFYAPHALSLALPGVACPVGTDGLYYGLAHPAVQASHESLAMLGAPRSIVVSTRLYQSQFVDEALTIGHLAVVEDGVSLSGVREQLGIDQGGYEVEVRAALGQLEDATANVQKALSGLAGSNSLLAKEVALNACLIARAADPARSLKDDYLNALGAIDSGEALEKLVLLVRRSGGEIPQWMQAVG